MIDNNLKVHDCIKCDMYKYRRTIVSGRGPTNAKVVLIGEAPGAAEDKYSIPFIGNSGQILRKILRFLHIEPKELYITNTVKCRPPNNRAPTSIELDNCMPYLIRELTVIKPKIIVLLGSTAFRTFYPNSMRTLSMERDKLKVVKGTIILTTYHPSYIIRNKTNVLIVGQFIKDLLTLQTLMRYL